MPKIQKIKAREILDSRGNPTVETEVFLDNGIRARAAVPSGASTGRYEALELRDKNSDRYNGKGVLTACANVEKIIAPVLLGQEPDAHKTDQTMIDLDGTKNKTRLGANAILGVSLAIARAEAIVNNLPLYHYLKIKYGLDHQKYKMPTPMFNVINGGKHSDSGLDVQEFMVIPLGEQSFGEKLMIGTEIFNALREVLKSRKLSFAVGDEGGFAPKLKKTEKAFDLLVSIADFTQHQVGKDVFLGIDAAASVFYDEKAKKYLFEKKKRSNRDLFKIYWQWFKSWPLFSIEDPFGEDDWEIWSEFTEKVGSLGSKLIIGDDLFSTNIERFKKGIANKSANAILIKLNQIGTLTETMECIKLAQKNNYKAVISHRSGETNDDFIADLAVGAGADFIKSGAPNRGERVAKYNRLMEIEKEIGQ